MDARVEAERETADEGWPGRRRGKDRKEGKRKSSGNQSCKSPVHCCKWGGGKKHPPQEFIQTPPFVPCCNLHVIVYTFTSLLAPLRALIAIPTKY